MSDPFTLLVLAAFVAFCVSVVGMLATALFAVRRRRRFERRMDEALKRIAEVRNEIRSGARPSGPRFRA